MGEIIIKVPEDVKEIIDLGLSYKEIKKKLEDIEKVKVNLIKDKELRIQKIKEFLDKYGGKLNIGEINEKELYLQGD